MNCPRRERITAACRRAEFAAGYTLEQHVDAVMRLLDCRCQVCLAVRSIQLQQEVQFGATAA